MISAKISPLPIRAAWPKATEMNWRIKLVIGAWLIAAIAGALLLRNLTLGGWKDLPVVSWVVLLPVALLLFTGSYFLVREARRQSK
jgi:hypothetical protein